MEESRKTIEIGPAREAILQVYGDLELRRADAPSLVVEGDPDLVARARAEARGETLDLTLGRDWLERLASGIAMLGNRPLRYVLALPSLERLEVGGRGRLRIEGLRSDRFVLRVAGLADGSLRDLDLGELDVEIAGRGELSFAGRAVRERLRISGSGRIDAYGLDADRATVRIGGHGDVGVSARETLDVRIAGYGHVGYEGDPRVHETISGGGSVHRREGGSSRSDPSGRGRAEAGNGGARPDDARDEAEHRGPRAPDAPDPDAQKG